MTCDALRMAVVLALLCCAGCAGGPSQVQLVSAGGSQFTQTFSQGYVSRDPSGDWHIMLVEDGVRTPAGQKPGAVLNPLAEVPLRQVVHIHVFWRPSEGAKADNPAATNAAIDWRILGTGAEQYENALHYQGSAFVSIDGEGKDLAARIRNGEMRLARVNGNLRDPLGDTRLRGNLNLERDDAVVKNMLSQLRSDEKEMRAGIQGPPPRRNDGP